MSPRDPRTPLNILCETPVWDGILESHFIKEILLGGLDRPLRMVTVSDAQAAPPTDNSLIINLFDRSVPLIKKFISAGCRNVGVFHMGDEHARYDRSYYKDVDYVLRKLLFPRNAAIACKQPLSRRAVGSQWLPHRRWAAQSEDDLADFGAKANAVLCGVHRRRRRHS